MIPCFWTMSTAIAPVSAMLKEPPEAPKDARASQGGHKDKEHAVQARTAAPNQRNTRRKAVYDVLQRPRSR